MTSVSPQSPEPGNQVTVNWSVTDPEGDGITRVTATVKLNGTTMITLNITGNQGSISFTPTEEGTYTVTITAVDNFTASQKTGSIDVSIPVSTVPTNATIVITRKQ